MSLTIDHKLEGEILVESVFFDSCKDGVLPSVFLSYVPDHQGDPLHVVSGALLCCHHTILKPVGKPPQKQTFSVSVIIFTGERCQEDSGKKRWFSRKGGRTMESKVVVIPGISGKSYQMTSGTGNARSLGESL